MNWVKQPKEQDCSAWLTRRAPDSTMRHFSWEVVRMWPWVHVTLRWWQLSPQTGRLWWDWGGGGWCSLWGSQPSLLLNQLSGLDPVSQRRPSAVSNLVPADVLCPLDARFHPDVHCLRLCDPLSPYLIVPSECFMAPCSWHQFVSAAVFYSIIYIMDCQSLG